ncbi:MAG: DUF4331 family protein [Sandaracinaceae bacterium]
MKKGLALIAMAVLAVPFAALAADHTDFPDATSDPTADITDLYAWTSDDAATVRLVLDVLPNASSGAGFSTATQYVFHVGNTDAFGGDTEERSIVCQPYTPTEVECWVLDAGGDVLDYVGGDATPESGITSDSGDVRMFAGQRQDPFFFNLSGFEATRLLVLDAAGGLQFDDAGCPAVDEATATALVTRLQTDGDTFAGQNILSIVLEVDRSLLTRAGNDILAIWASSHRAPS